MADNPISNVLPANPCLLEIGAFRVQRPIKKAGDTTDVKYLLRPVLVDSSGDQIDVPLVVFLHGASARGDTFEAHLQMGLPAIIDEIEGNGIIPSTDRFVLLAPLCPMGVEFKTSHMADAILELIEDICKRMPQINRRRVYLTGISMGGLGAWVLAARAPPQTFAALSPMCGGGPPMYARLLATMPTWFFHSVEDNVIGVEETDALYSALVSEGSTVVKYTRYASCPEPAAKEWMVGHNCWNRTYRDRQFWEWLLSQSSNDC